MNPDFVDLLRAFIDAEVRFMIVDASALAVHDRPRATGDLVIWTDATPDNASRVMQALTAFGAPLGEIAEPDFAPARRGLSDGRAPGPDVVPA